MYTQQQLMITPGVRWVVDRERMAMVKQTKNARGNWVKASDNVGVMALRPSKRTHKCGGTIARYGNGRRSSLDWAVCMKCGTEVK